MTASPAVTPWPNFEPPSREQLQASFREEDLSPSWWSNAPGEVYAGHSHPYHKVLYCAQGSIQFAIEPSGKRIDLAPRARLDIPPGIAHSAVVGP